MDTMEILGRTVGYTVHGVAESDMTEQLIHLSLFLPSDNVCIIQ